MLQHVIYLTETERIKLYGTLKWVMAATVMTADEKKTMLSLIEKFRSDTAPSPPKRPQCP